jgi:hypothetical protein
MLKSSSLCLYSSNLGTFWLKIEQFWPFLKPLNQIKPNLAGMVPGWVPLKFVSVSDVLYPRWPAGHNFGRRTTQESFQQSLAEIGPVVSDEKIFFLISFPLFLICIISRYIPIMQIWHILIKDHI